MRTFIVLSLLLAAANAAQLGYNYNPGSSNSIPVSGSGILSGSIGGGSSRGSSILSGSIGGGSSGGLAGPVSYSAAPQTQYEKEFYSFYANEDDFDDQEAARKIAASVKKSVRVIFIKAPENRGFENAALALAKQAAEQQTAIYVLSKQTDINELAQKFNAVRNNQNNKPEVHFVKYRTPQDAVNAQQAIQSQYDSLGGTSQSINGGVANALNFASRSQAPVQQAPIGVSQVPETNYLPSNILRRLRLRR